MLALERDPSPIRVLGVAAVGLLAALVVYMYAGMWPALATLLMVAGLLWLLLDIVAALRLPHAAREASRRALGEFQAAYPEEQVGGVALRAVEQDRYVFSVRYGRGRPTPRRYYAVSKETMVATEIADSAEYWPRGLK